MTLKEEEITRKEMAKILPSIQIGYIDKDVKRFLNDTIDDIIVEETKEQMLTDNIVINKDKKIDIESENKTKDETESIKVDAITGIQNISDIKDVKEAIIEEDIPSSAAEDVNSFLNNLLQCGHRILSGSFDLGIVSMPVIW